MDWTKGFSADRRLWLVDGKDALSRGDWHGIQESDKIRRECDTDKHPIKIENDAMPFSLP